MVEFIGALQEMEVAAQVAQNTSSRRSAVPRSTLRGYPLHASNYGLSSPWSRMRNIIFSASR